MLLLGGISSAPSTATTNVSHLQWKKQSRLRPVAQPGMTGPEDGSLAGSVVTHCDGFTALCLHFTEQSCVRLMAGK